ncbi:MAG: phage tail protein [Burkholderiaceae bacterium]
MYKPNSLRAHLTAAIPELRRDPDKLLLFADEGNIVATNTGSLSFEYQYKLNLILTDYGGAADAVTVALLAWLAVHQLDLLANPDKRKSGVRFEVDFNSHASIDLALALDLSERVLVVPGSGGRLDVRHLAEPQATPDYADQFWTLYQGDTLLAEWHTPPAAP